MGDISLLQQCNKKGKREAKKTVVLYQLHKIAGTEYITTRYLINYGSYVSSGYGTGMGRALPAPVRGPWPGLRTSAGRVRLEGNHMIVRMIDLGTW